MMTEENSFDSRNFGFSCKKNGWYLLRFERATIKNGGVSNSFVGVKIWRFKIWFGWA